MSAAPTVRQRFGRYEVLFPIAAGGMAEVFAARALGEGGFQKLVALKRMRPEMTDDVKFTTMFLDEGRMAANIASPNVVSTLDLGRADDNSLFLVMELVSGVPLATLLQEAMLRQEKLPLGIAIDILCQAANGLHDAHEAKSPAGEPLGIIHRDVSPHNVLVDVNGVAKITDFGIAKALERQTRSTAGEMKGKLSYLSPEQARGRDIDRRADIFILGIVAWEVITNKRLFTGNGPVEVLHKIATMEVPRLDVVRADVSPEIADVVQQALARKPDERFRTARAFGNALGHAYGKRPPPRSDIGALVRRLGGDALNELESGIRAAAGGSQAPPPVSDPAYPIPLAPKSFAPDTIPEEPIADGTVPMSPLELPEEVRAHLAPDGPPAAVPAPPAVPAPAVPAPAVPPPPKVPGDFGSTIRVDSLNAAELNLDRPIPQTMPTMQRKVETYRPPAPAMMPEEPVPPPPTSKVLPMLGGLMLVALLLGGGFAVWLLFGRDVDTGASTTSVPPVAVPSSSPEEGSEETVEPAPALEPVEPELTPEAPEVVEAHARPDRRRRAGRAQPTPEPTPVGPPPARVQGRDDPVGDREAAFQQVFGN